MRAVWIVTFTAILAACSGGPVSEQNPAGVEDRQPGAAGAQSQGVKPGDVARVDLTAGQRGRNLLTDPGSILSRRSIFYDLDQYDVKDQYKEMVEAHAKNALASSALTLDPTT